MTRLSWRSIEFELPISIFGFLVLVIGVLSSSVYYEVRAGRMENASQRLESVTSELAGLTENSVEQRIRQARSAAAAPRIHDFLMRGGPDAPARAYLDSLVESSANLAAMELYDASGRRSVVPAATIEVDPEAPAKYAGSEAFVGPIEVGEEGFVSETVAPVLDETGLVHGYLVQRRRAASATAVRELMSQLIGSDALFLVGNSRGGEWTDLVGTVAPPPREVLIDSVARTYSRDSGVVSIGAAAPIAGTPWHIMVEFPVASVLQPVRTFLVRLAVTASLLVFAGAIGAWTVSRRITSRLRRATSAAKAVASGDFDQRIVDGRADELGELASAFNAMADNVENSRRQLENQVTARTRELNDALEDLRSTQAELVRSERLAVLGQLSSGLGHELRNPLGVMSNAVYFLEAITNGDDPRVPRYLTIIREQVGLSEKIVGDLLDFARIKAPNRTDFVLAEVVGQQVARLAFEQATDVEQAIPEELVVRGDPVQLGQAIFNLLSNACQAMEESETRRLTITGDVCPAGRVVLHVSDTGCGIPAEQIDDIFEPLFTTRARGIGLGLALTRSFVAANDGEIAVRSDVGRGTTVSVWVPSAPVAVPA